MLVWFKDYCFLLFGIIISLSGIKVRLWLNLFEWALVIFFFWISHFVGLCFFGSKSFNILWTLLGTSSINSSIYKELIWSHSNKVVTIDHPLPYCSLKWTFLANGKFSFKTSLSMFGCNFSFIPCLHVSNVFGWFSLIDSTTDQDKPYTFI